MVQLCPHPPSLPACTGKAQPTNVIEAHGLRYIPETKFIDIMYFIYTALEGKIQRVF